MIRLANSGGPENLLYLLLMVHLIQMIQLSKILEGQRICCAAVDGPLDPDDSVVEDWRATRSAVSVVDGPLDRTIRLAKILEGQRICCICC